VTGHAGAIHRICGLFRDRAVVRARIRLGGPCQTRSMAFKVYRHGQTPVQQFGDEDRFEILEGGVLKIRRQHGTNLYINAALWASIEETPAPSVYASPGHSSDDGVPPDEQPC
jgi:hypothetical protein